VGVGCNAAACFEIQMNFSQQEQTLGKRFGGLTFVVLLHVLVLYAMVSGLAKRVVDVVRAPIETKVIEEVKAPPPPPDVVVPPPPKLDAPPPPFIPPPEVQIAAPPPVQATITATTPTPPPAVVEIAPVAPPVVAAPAPVVAAPPPPKQVVASIGVACQKLVAPVMPTRAVDEGINGAVKARITIRNSKVINVDIISARPRGVFEAAVRTAMMKYSCQTEGDQIVTAEQEFQFKLDE
jgi:periplasmic protein TonB